MKEVAIFVPKGTSIDALLASAKEAIESRGGMTNVSFSDDIDTSKLPRVGGQVVLAAGTSFILTGKSVQIKAEINGQNADYPALLAITGEGKPVFIAYNSILQPWLPESFDEGDRRAEMYSDSTMQKVGEFYRSHNKATVVNSPENGFVFTATIEERLEKLSGPLKVEEVIPVKGTFTKDGVAGTITNRLYAFKKLTSAEAAKFNKGLEETYKATAKN